MTVQHKTHEQERHIRFLHRAFLGMLCALVFLGWAFWRVPEQLTVYVVPDMSKGFVQKSGEVPASSVYGFARTLWETLNYCKTDCGEEYPKNLENYSVYLTRACYDDLFTHFQHNRSLYNFRSRLLLPTENSMFSQDKVRQDSSGDYWLVKLEYELRDTVHGAETRNSRMVYPLKVVRSDKPIAHNGLGLDVDCYFGDGPQVLAGLEDKK